MAVESENKCELPSYEELHRAHSLLQALRAALRPGRHISQSVGAWSLHFRYSVHKHLRHIAMLPPCHPMTNPPDSLQKWVITRGRRQPGKEEGTLELGSELSVCGRDGRGTQRRWECPAARAIIAQEDRRVPEEGTPARVFT